MLDHVDELKRHVLEISKSSGLSVENIISDLSNSFKSEKQSGLICERYGLFPIQDEDAYKFSKKQEDTFWTSTELSFVDDKEGYERLPCDQKRLIDISLSFFLLADSMVNENIIVRFMNDAKTPEEKRMFVMQMAIESVHEDAYGLMVHTLYSPAKITELKAWADSAPYMRRKFDFINKWICSSESFTSRLLAFACVEGISFAILFVIIFWFKGRGNQLPNLNFTNEQISKDETLHRDFGCFLYRRYGSLSYENALEIVLSLVKVEEEFIDWLFEQGDVCDLSPGDFKEYLHLTADNLLVEAGHLPYFGASNPFTWMIGISLTQKHNFFEKRGGNYRRDIKYNKNESSIGASLYAEDFGQLDDIDF